MVDPAPAPDPGRPFASAPGPEPAPSRRRMSIGGDDWPAQAADQVVHLVDQVKSRTTDNAVVAVRAVVYGILLAVIGSTMLVLVVIALVRLADAYLPIGDGVGSATWAAHGFVGALFLILGFGAWGSRRSSNTPMAVAAAVVVVAFVAVIVYGIIDGVA